MQEIRKQKRRKRMQNLKTAESLVALYIYIYIYIEYLVNNKKKNEKNKFEDSS